MTDGELVRQARAGDTAAYGHLVRRRASRVLGVCHAHTGNADAAEDLAQEALLRGLRALPTLAEPEKFGSWLTGIATRACLDWLKDRRRTEVSLDAIAGGQSASPTWRLSNGIAESAASREEDAARERRERAEQLIREVERLPQPYREVLMLYYYQPDGCTYRDLAEMLGVSTATVNARMTQARKMLRSRMMAQRVRDE